MFSTVLFQFRNSTLLTDEDFKPRMITMTIFKTKLVLNLLVYFQPKAVKVQVGPLRD